MGFFGSSKRPKSSRLSSRVKRAEAKARKLAKRAEMKSRLAKAQNFIAKHTGQ